MKGNGTIIIRHCLILLASVCYSFSIANADLEIGGEVPDFKLETLAGESYTLSDFFEGTVILEWINPDCPAVRRLHEDETMKELREQSVPFGMKWFAINSTHYMTPEKAQAWADKMEVEVPMLIDRDGHVGKAFGARTTPHLFIIHNGLLVYQGAIDDDPRGDNPRAKRHSFVETAIRDLHEHRAIKVPFKKPYGCSVKYEK